MSVRACVCVSGSLALMCVPVFWCACAVSCSLNAFCRPPVRLWHLFMGLSPTHPFQHWSSSNRLTQVHSRFSVAVGVASVCAKEQVTHTLVHQYSNYLTFATGYRIYRFVMCQHDVNCTVLFLCAANLRSAYAGRHWITSQCRP